MHVHVIKESPTQKYIHTHTHTHTHTHNALQPRLRVGEVNNLMQLLLWLLYNYTAVSAWLVARLPECHKLAHSGVHGNKKRNQQQNSKNEHYKIIISIAVNSVVINGS